jgi:ATP-dependent DNA ligase
MSLITGPVALMRLVTVDSISELDRLLTRMGLAPQHTAVETKFNGWLAQAAGGRLYSRRGKDLTDKFPHIAKLIAPFTKEHLIGELVYFDENGIMQEPAVTTVAGTKDPKEAIRKMREMPGRFEYVVFDVLAADGKDVTDESTATRRGILDECFCNSGITLSNPQPLSMIQQVYDEGVDAGGDGVVIKNLRAPYAWRPFGQSEVQPVGYWWKLKPVFSDNFVVTGTRRGPKGNLLAILSQFYEGDLVEVSDVNNFSAMTTKEILRRMEQGPFLVEIAYQSRFPDPPGALNIPRFIRFRDDQDLDSAQLPKKYAPGR